MEDSEANKHTYDKIQEIISRSNQLKILESTDSFQLTSKWIFAGTIYAIFNFILNLEGLKKNYSASNLKFFIVSLTISLLFGILYSLIFHFNRIKQESIEETLESNKQHEQKYLAHELVRLGFSDKFGVSRKEHYLKIFKKEAIKKNLFFFVQVLFFLAGFIVIISDAFQQMN